MQVMRIGAVFGHGQRRRTGGRQSGQACVGQPTISRHNGIATADSLSLLCELLPDHIPSSRRKRPSSIPLRNRRFSTVEVMHFSRSFQ